MGRVIQGWNLNHTIHQKIVKSAITQTILIKEVNTRRFESFFKLNIIEIAREF
jgi:hypothetical protein